MNTHDIELSPLPEARIVSYQTDSTMRRMELRTYSDEDVKDFARSAIEADRKQRSNTKPSTNQDWLSLDPAVAFHLIERNAENWNDAGAMMQAYLDAHIEADRKRRTPPNEPFAIVIDRMYEGEGPSLAYWNGENYQFSDGDCYNREGDTLDGYTAEFLTDHQLEKRLFDDRKHGGEPVAPDGWKLVPVTPTSKQIVHMALQIKGADADGWFRTDGDDWPEHVAAAERAYKWALSEAPQPSEPVAKPVSVTQKWQDGDDSNMVSRVAEPVKVPRPHEFNTGNEKLDTLLDDTYYLVEYGGMDNAIKWHESLQEFLTILEPVKVPSDAEMAAIWDEAHKPFGGAPFLMSHVEYSRALLARYGSTTQEQP